MTSPLPNRQPLQRYLRVQVSTDQQTRLVLERAARDIEARIARLNTDRIGGQVRANQLRLVLTEIREIQHEMWRQGITPVLAVGRKAAAEAAVVAADELQAVLYAALPEGVAQAVSNGLTATARAGIETDYARVPRALSARVYDNFALTSGQVEQAIRAGIVQGLSARELAQTIYSFISPTTPGGASYAAMRLARTEINNAFHEQQKKMGQRPGVTAVHWNLSGSHPKPDECNTFAEQDRDDLGPGNYKPGDVPNKPHPQCLCFMSYVMMTPEQWQQAFKRGTFDDELDRRTRANLQRLGIKDETPFIPSRTPAPVKKTTPAKKEPSTNPKAVRARARRAAKKTAPPQVPGPTPITPAAPVKTTKATPAPQVRLFPPKAPIPHSDVIEAYLKTKTDKEALIQTLVKARLAPNEHEARRAVESVIDRLGIGKPVKTPKLDGLPRFTPDRDRLYQVGKDINAKADNPKFRESRQYQINCTHVANAHEMRARGYDVSASKLPRGLNGRQSQEVLERWRLPDGRLHGRSIEGLLTFDEAEAEAKSWPDGARGWVRVSWDDRIGGGGHIFNVEKIRGQIRWIEGQKGEYAPMLHYRQNARGGHASTTWGIVRVDDLVPTDAVFDLLEAR